MGLGRGEVGWGDGGDVIEGIGESQGEGEAVGDADACGVGVTSFGVGEEMGV